MRSVGGADTYPETGDGRTVRIEAEYKWPKDIYAVFHPDMNVLMLTSYNGYPRQV